MRINFTWRKSYIHKTYWTFSKRLTYVQFKSYVQGLVPGLELKCLQNFFTAKNINIIIAVENIQFLHAMLAGTCTKQGKKNSWIQNLGIDALISASARRTVTWNRIKKTVYMSTEGSLLYTRNFLLSLELNLNIICLWIDCLVFGREPNNSFYTWSPEYFKWNFLLQRCD